MFCSTELAGGSGLDVLNTLRQGGLQVPVVFLTGISLAERELQAFNYGAVDFIDKLRGIDVLVQRLRVIVEGQRKLSADAAPKPLLYGNLTLLPDAARARWGLHDVGLTLTEYGIVAFLASLEGQPATYRAIYDVAHYSGFVAGTGERGYETNVRSLMKRIRRKFLSVDPGFAQTFTGRNWATAGPRPEGDAAAPEPVVNEQAAVACGRAGSLRNGDQPIAAR